MHTDSELYRWVLDGPPQVAWVRVALCERHIRALGYEKTYEEHIAKLTAERMLRKDDPYPSDLVNENEQVLFEVEK
jgi:hypothetical protein